MSSARPRTTLAAALLAALPLTAGRLQAQQPPAGAPATKKAAPPAAVRLPKADEVLATVNGDKITRADVIQWLSSFPIQQGQEQEAYDVATYDLANAKLLGQYLARMRAPVDQKAVDAELARFEKNVLEPQKVTLSTFLADSGMPLDELKKRFTERQQWHNYLMSKATDAELRKYFAAYKDIFDGKQVKASHILLKVDPSASPADKEKVKARLLGIRNEIATGKIGFADAANKYSEDTMGEAKNGGDLDFFPRRGKYLDAFADAAFTLKKGDVSQPILTEYGWHLIQPTDAMPGKAVDFAQIKEQVLAQYGQELNEAIVNAERAKAKIEVKPLPADLFPKLPAQPAPKPTVLTTPGEPKNAGSPAPKP